ncbi:MAG: TraX family protein [Oscillospiraceae bacterium]|nr:TraX family protein [Oscillospiraceae bacterium]
MTAFALKLLALLCMLLDHLAVVFGASGWNLLPFDTAVLRYLGRISFPIFAFCLVGGWQYTHDRAAYMKKLALCAVFSQIPYSLALYAGNLTAVASVGACYAEVVWAVLPAAAICVAAYLHFVPRKQGVWAVAAACLLPSVLMRLSGVFVLAKPLNVLYTLLLGGVGMFAIGQIRAGRLRRWESFWLAAAFAAAGLVYGLRADYGLMGLALILGLYLAGPSKLRQCATLCLWSVLYYGLLFGNWNHAVAAMFAAVPILLYQGQPGANGRAAKRLFYVFYPVHLLLLGLLHFLIRA